MRLPISAHDPDAVYCDNCGDGPLKSRYVTEEDDDGDPRVTCAACLEDAKKDEGDAS